MPSILTFSIEDSYGVQNLSQDYTLDLLEETIVDNLNYEKIPEFNYPSYQRRIKKTESVSGRASFELTYGNQAWNIFFQTLLGQRIRLTDSAFMSSPESWNIVTGMLESAITSSQTSFNITEYFTGEFNNIDGIIIDKEYIAVNSISNGAISSSSRAQKGTSAASHLQGALVYGVVNDISHSVDICCRYRNGFCYYLPTSLTLVINRLNEYFGITGANFEDMIFHADPLEGVSLSTNIVGNHSEIETISSPAEIYDSNQLVSSLDLNCYSMGERFDLSSLYFEVSNSISQSPTGFFKNISPVLLLNRFSTYGQFTVGEQTNEFYNEYKNDTTKNLSLSACDDRLFTKVYVLSFNNIKWGTMVHALRNSRLLYDSVPFYCYGEDSFNLLIQN